MKYTDILNLTLFCLVLIGPLSCFDVPYYIYCSSKDYIGSCHLKDEKAFFSFSGFDS